MNQVLAEIQVFEIVLSSHQAKSVALDVKTVGLLESVHVRTYYIASAPNLSFP